MNGFMKPHVQIDGELSEKFGQVQKLRRHVLGFQDRMFGSGASILRFVDQIGSPAIIVRTNCSVLFANSHWIDNLGKPNFTSWKDDWLASVSQQDQSSSETQLVPINQ